MQLTGTHRTVFAAIGLCASAVLHAQVVVLVNPATGNYVVVHDQENPKAIAAKRANEKAPGGGWEPLLVSDTPGYGTMFCLRVGDTTEFFLEHGKTTSKEAITSASARANAAAGNTKEISYWCGAWKNENKFPLEPGGPAKTPAPEQGSNAVTGVRG
jgi:hypothetical protein